ncbi:hypothetical protein ACFL59_07880 [Planctomycetota bacterium]
MSYADWDGHTDLARNVRRLLAHDDRPLEERERLLQLIGTFVGLPVPTDPFRLYPRYGVLKQQLISAAYGADFEALEEAFLTLYCHVHGHEAPYTAEERRRVDETGGYWCHAGGISPLLKAGPFIDADTVSGDFGAGNGLQGLLLQKLSSHRRTVQIEISSRMVEAGKHLQRWLSIPGDRVVWRVEDVLGASPAEMSFVYLYRPVRPEGEGRRFYESFAAELARSRRPQVIFSIADCLRGFVTEEFEVFYCDGHLTCFRRRLGEASRCR